MLDIIYCEVKVWKKYAGIYSGKRHRITQRKYTSLEIVIVTSHPPSTSTLNNGVGILIIKGRQNTHDHAGKTRR
eukprot:Pgem_evm1s2582